jgi:hypothetical protein
MKLECKYELGQLLYAITSTTYYVWEPCVICDGEGYIYNPKEVKFLCPKCCGNKGSNKYGDRRYVQSHSGYVGKIAVELLDRPYVEDTSYRSTMVTYMLDTSGVISGTLWGEDNLFATSDDAQKECDKRNNIV